MNSAKQWKEVTMDINDMISVLKAYKKGKTIQSYDDENQCWCDNISPSWNFGELDYRIKPDNEE